MSSEQGDALWPKGKVGGNYEDKKQHKPVRIPFPKASDPKKLMPIRCPLPDHDKHSGMPLRFGIGPSEDRELEKKLLANMRLSDIDKMVEEAGPSDNVAVALEIASARGKERKEPHPPEKPKRTSSSSGGGDMSLMTAMAGRLRNAEEAATELRELLRQRDATIAELRRSIAHKEGMEFVRRSSSHSGSDALGAHSSDADLGMLKEHNAKLREMLRKADADNTRLAAENTEIKAFLKDYGMQWVGTAGAPTSGASSLSHSPDSAAASSPDSADLKLKEGMWEPGVALTDAAPDPGAGGIAALSCAFDAVRIAGNVKQLNFVAGEGEKEIAVGADGMRRFKEKSLVSYVFYKNGIWARGGPLRPYHLQESSVLVRDLMDGYFPWELKDDYPEGVPLKVEFRLAENCGADSTEQAALFKPFGGAGQVLGAASGAPRAQQQQQQQHAVGAGSWAREVGFVAPSAPQAASAAARDQLFRRLPPTVVTASGDVVSVKEDLMKLVQGDNRTEKTGLSKVEQIEIVSSQVPQDSTSTEISTLRIKTPDGGHLLELKLPYDSTIGELREALRGHLARGDGKVLAFTLRTTFPAREYDADAATLREAGLVPNALLLMTLVT